MSESSLPVTPERQRELERFYFYEARLLDNRLYKQWLGLVSEQVRYTVPSRINAQLDNRDREREEMLSVDRELEGAGSGGCPVREETYVHLMVRVERAYKINSWAEQPPARTRRIVGNVELMEEGDEGLHVLSNFHLHWARPGNSEAFYSGQRRDLLLPTDDSFRLLRRDVVLDYADIALPTLGLLF